MRKLNFYRIHTNCPGMQIFDLSASPSYREILDQKDHGFINHGGGTVSLLPETKHTYEMLAESYIDTVEYEEDTDDWDKMCASAIYDTESKEVAKQVLKAIAFQAGAGSQVMPGDVNFKNKLAARNAVLVKFWDSRLDKSSPRDVIRELEQELNQQLNLKNMKTALQLKKEEVQEMAERTKKPLKQPS